MEWLSGDFKFGEATMKQGRDRTIGLKARPVRNIVVAMLTELRTVLADDVLYESALHQVEGWIIGQRSWLTAVAKQVANADSGERPDGVNPPSGGNELLQLGLPPGSGEREQHDERSENGSALGGG